MKENSGQETVNPAKRDLAPPDRKQGAQPQPQTPPQPQPPPQQGMSSGAKWGIGLGACCCCLIIAFLIFIILGFAGCSFVRGLGGYNWPAAPPIDEGAEIPIPSFSTTPR